MVSWTIRCIYNDSDTKTQHVNCDLVENSNANINVHEKLTINFCQTNNKFELLFVVHQNN